MVRVCTTPSDEIDFASTHREYTEKIRVYILLYQELKIIEVNIYLSNFKYVRKCIIMNCNVIVKFSRKYFYRISKYIQHSIVHYKNLYQILYFITVHCNINVKIVIYNFFANLYFSKPFLHRIQNVVSYER